MAVGPQRVSSGGAAELLDAGAVGWVVSATEPPKERVPTPRPAAGLSAPAKVVDISRVSGAEPWEYLTHWTRRCDGPWPDQREEEYLEELIVQPDRADRSPLATLRRIIHTRRLRASPRAIRGGAAVVCFTAVPLADLPHRRVFRPHRTRWDFEPYGICLRRDWLVQRGARPVQYGQPELWSALPEEERPFFQAGQTRGRGRVMDWTAEEEWRHVGDLPLDKVPADAALVFVPSEAEAAGLAEESPWPVVVLAGGDRRPGGRRGKPR